MDRGDDYRHGFSDEVWERAKNEGLEILRKRAAKREPISYSEFCDKLGTIAFDPHDTRLAHFLGQISTEEDEQGRPLITALVVHKHDGQPGDGFFNLAESLGHEFDDREAFWIKQINALAEVSTA